MSLPLRFFIATGLCLTLSAPGLFSQSPVLVSPKIILQGVPQDLIFEVPEGDSIAIQGLGKFRAADGEVKLKDIVLSVPICIDFQDQHYSFHPRSIPGFLSLFPPLLTIGLAFLLKDVLAALFLGLFSGWLVLQNYNPLKALFALFNDGFIRELKDPFHLKILVFTISIASLIGMIYKSGALGDLVVRLSRKISSPRSGMVATWFLGLLVFFDDYANSLLIGNTLRPLTDKLRISREKFSYLVDSTAAPVASLGISTWIGTQISLMEDSFKAIDPGIRGMELFLNAWPYNFYSIFTVVFVLCVAWFNRDYGPMGSAERRARKTGAILAADAVPMQDENDLGRPYAQRHYLLAALPLLLMILTTVLMIYISGATSAGFDKPLADILNDADTSGSLMMGPIAGILLFYFLSIRKASLRELTGSIVSGAKSVFISVLILTLAWSIGTLCKDLNTSGYLISLLGDRLYPTFLPFILFIASGLIAFATGTSWGTMAVMFPVAIPMVCHILTGYHIPVDATQPVLLASMASILTGSVLGDHASPISDTTLFSSMACGADHMHHVKTQAPYALTVGAIAVGAGYLPLALGLHWSVCLILGVALCFVAVRFLGKSNPS